MESPADFVHARNVMGRVSRALWMARDVSSGGDFASIFGAAEDPRTDRTDLGKRAGPEWVSTKESEV